MPTYSSIRLKPRTENLFGEPFGRWTVIAFAGYYGGNAYWTCECVCGTVKDRPAEMLKRGTSQSCGCLRSELNTLHKTTHGMTDTPEFTTWQQMFNRCYNPNEKSYPNYGGRGIIVCERWRTFEAFYADMGPRPSPKHSIDRYPDMNGPYSPENCRWATMQEQSRNRRTNRFITHHGETKTLGEWAESIGVSLVTFRQRLLRGQTMDEALTAPLRSLTPTNVPKELTHNGITQSLATWAKTYDLSYVTLYRRLLRGVPVAEALTRPAAVQKRPKDSYRY